MFYIFSHLPFDLLTIWTKIFKNIIKNSDTYKNRVENDLADTPKQNIQVSSTSFLLFRASHHIYQSNGRSDHPTILGLSALRLILIQLWVWLLFQFSKLFHYKAFAIPHLSCGSQASLNAIRWKKYFIQFNLLTEYIFTIHDYIY